MTRPRKWLGLALLLALVPLLLPTINLHRARRKILNSLQRELGRRVTADAVHLTLLPWPGFSLDNVAVADGPQFGGEAMVTAESAHATLRLVSVWSGRLEFSSIRLDYPVFNVVRNEQGRWNFADVLSQTASNSPAVRPTAAPQSLRQPARFPYVEFSNGRVNFKLGWEKKRIYLSAVEGSLELESGRWRVHTRFSPARTDANLSSTGDVVVDGWWAAGRQPFADLPFDLTLQLQRSYLAGATAVFVGHDAGVHGILNSQLRVRGTGHGIQISGRLQASSIRRWDLLPPDTAIEAAFAALYRPETDQLVIERAGDVSHRFVTTGIIDNLFTHPRMSLKVAVREFPADGVVTLVRVVKAGLPADLRATGILDGSATLRSAGDGLLPLEGNGFLLARGVEISNRGNRLNFPEMSWSWDGSKLELWPIRTSLTTNTGQSAALDLTASLTGTSFDVSVASPEVRASAVAALSQVWGVALPWPANVRGSADVQLAATSDWTTFREAVWTGRAEFHDAVFSPPGATAVRLRRAVIQYRPDRSVRADFDGVFRTSDVGGWVELPASTASPVRFSLELDHLDFATLRSAWQRPKESDWLRLLSIHRRPNFFATLNATGAITVRDLTWRGMHGSLQADLQGNQGNWHVPLIYLGLAHGYFFGSGSGRGGTFQLDGRISSMRVEQLLASTHYAGGVDGRLSGDVHIEESPSGAVAANGTLRLRNGFLHTNNRGLRFRDCLLPFRESEQGFDVSDGKLLTDGERYDLNGSGIENGVNFVLTSGSDEIRISGTPGNALIAQTIPTTAPAQGAQAQPANSTASKTKAAAPSPSTDLIPQK